MNDYSGRALATLPITIILNAGSGHDDKQRHREDIENALQAAGREYRILSTESPAEIESLARQAVAEGKEREQIIVAAGGDGTINTVASVVLDTGLPFGLIPMGTFNYFARDLGIPLEPGEAARALAEGKVRRVHVAQVNGNLFLNNASFGLYRHLQEEREQYKQRLGRYKLVAIIAALHSLWKHRTIYDVQLEIDGKPVALRTLMLFFGLNSLQLEKLDLEVAQCAANGLIAVIALRPMKPFELLRFALRGALQGLSEARNLRCYCASSVEVHWRGARAAKVAIDGETAQCAMPLHVTIARQALPVVVPREPEERK
jgi:diacylglycerol kinase family enzyme